MWTALIVRRVKMQPYLFTWLLPCFSINGPKKSIPTWLNGGCPPVTRSFGRSAIFWLHTWAGRRLQLKQLARSLRTTELARITQNLLRSSDRTYSLPEWPDVKMIVPHYQVRSMVVFRQNDLMFGIFRQRRMPQLSTNNQDSVHQNTRICCYLSWLNLLWAFDLESQLQYPDFRWGIQSSPWSASLGHT